MMEITNLIEDKKGSFSRIRVSGNRVELEVLRAKTLDEKNDWHTRREHDYSRLAIFKYGNYTYVEARDEEEKILDIYSINRCCKICSSHIDSLVVPRVVRDEIFFKIRLPEKQFIYDESGNLIDFSSKNSLDIISNQFGDFLVKKTDAKGRSSLWSFEQTMVTPWSTP